MLSDCIAERLTHDFLTEIVLSINNFLFFLANYGIVVVRKIVCKLFCFVEVVEEEHVLVLIFLLGIV